MVIDRLHHYLRKLIDLREAAGSFKEDVEKLRKELGSLRGKDTEASSQARSLREEVAGLGETLRRLKAEAEGKEKRAAAAEAHVAALQKQLEDLLLEYDRLLEDNQILQSQALAFRG